ncbi:PIN domain-containing protein [Patescibacteria group bacterium]|nr:PIN domain-containing protein [Patescibacteria group bacterium]MBU1256602.1 PIN domain-containing protein [Patescibacteria group bacterium]MBU1457514.1 PIN domain-containing protein [Patescibacteria group bacterium]
MSKIFIDTSGFKALVDEKDEFHSKAVKLWGKLLRLDDGFVVSNYILDESLTLVRMRRGLDKALKLRDFIAESSQVIKIYRVSIEDERGAWKWFEKDWSKLSFTDCVSFALMERLGIKRVFGFDKHFERAGFGLVK